MEIELVPMLVYLLAGLLLGLMLPILRGGKASAAKKIIPGLAPSDPQKGNLGDMAQAGSFHDFLCKNHARFGPLFTFWWADKQVCAIGHPEYFKCIQTLHTRPYIFKFLEPLITKKSLLYSNKEEYFRRKANYIDPAFLGRTISMQGDAISAILRDDYLPQWKKLAQSGEKLVTNNYFLELSIKVITRFALGEIFSDQQYITDINEADNLYWKYIEKANRGQIDASVQDLIKQSLGKLQAVCKSIIAHRRAQQPTEKKIFIDYLLNEEDADLHICELITVFIAGFHTSGTLLSWIMYDLCRHPALQAEIQKEIDEKCAGSGEVLSLEEAGKLEKLRNVIDESLRLHALVMFQARFGEEDVKFPDDYVVPAGMPIIISEGKVNLDNGIFKDAGEYLPARFETSEGRDPVAFTPFGYAGKRSCPGKLLAYAEETIVLGTFFKHFNVRFHETQTLPVLPEYQIVTVQKADVVVVIEPRRR